MEIKLSTGEKVKLKDLSVDERDELLDSVEYEYDDGNSVSHPAKGLTQQHVKTLNNKGA